jgi:hypothetical protein
MASYATYCEDQAADCARRARLARSSEVAAYCRSLQLRWMRLAEQHKSSTRDEHSELDARRTTLARNATTACRQGTSV